MVKNSNVDVRNHRSNASIDLKNKKRDRMKRNDSYKITWRNDGGKVHESVDSSKQKKEHLVNLNNVNPDDADGERSKNAVKSQDGANLFLTVAATHEPITEK